MTKAAQRKLRLNAALAAGENIGWHVSDQELIRRVTTTESDNPAWREVKRVLGGVSKRTLERDFAAARRYATTELAPPADIRRSILVMAITCARAAKAAGNHNAVVGHLRLALELVDEADGDDSPQSSIAELLRSVGRGADGNGKQGNGSRDAGSRDAGSRDAGSAGSAG